MQTFYLYNPTDGAYETIAEDLDAAMTYAREGTVEIALRPTDGGTYRYNADAGAWEPFTWPEPTPEEAREAMPHLTARQLRLGLLGLGKLDAVSAAIEELPEPDRSQARIEWEYASEFRRTHPLILQMIPILGLTDEQVDVVWMQSSTV